MSPRTAEYDLDNDDDDELDDQEPNGQQANGQREPRLSRSDLRKLREKARKHDEMEQKLQAMERKELFRDAGVNPSDAKFKYFVKGYDGEMTVEAIQKEAAEAGLITLEPENPPEEVEGHQKIDQAGAGAAPTGKVDALEKLKGSEAKSLDEFIDEARKAGLPTSLDGVD